MWATLPAITARSFPKIRRQSCMAQAGTIRRTLVPQCGMAGLIPTEWEPGSLTAPDTGWSFGFGYGYGYYPYYYPWWGPMGYYGYGWYPVLRMGRVGRSRCG